MAKKQEKMDEVRIDKWLWAVRIFKTRTIAANACKNNRVSIDEINVKPARLVRVGDVIQVKRPPVTYSFEVLDLSEKRMGAKLVLGFAKNRTPSEELEVLQMKRMAGFVDRARGTGRPTKKDRRDLEDFTDELLEEWDFDFED